LRAGQTVEVRDEERVERIGETVGDGIDRAHGFMGMAASLPSS
jgi:hypothetical protein